MKLTAQMTNSYQVKVEVDGHEYVVDQPKEKGGKGTGANPSAILIAAIASCKTMVAKGFLDTKKIPYERVDTHVDYQFSGSNMHATVEMTVYVEVIGAKVDVTQRRQLQLIVETGCPVANVIDSEKNKIKTIVTVL